MRIRACTNPGRPMPKLLDLFCGEGGAGMGYHRAGFEVIGVDLNRRALRRYPSPCIQGDALEVAAAIGHRFDAIHASPPCQAYSSSTPDRSAHWDSVPPTRDTLDAIGLPYVIENVPGSPLRRDIVLCGSMFALSTGSGLALQRHRHFEINWPHHGLSPATCWHKPGNTVSVAGNGTPQGNRQTLGRNVTVDEWREVMGMDWASRNGLAQAIPPAYTEWIGSCLNDSL